MLTNLTDLNQDVLGHIFSFLEPEEVLNVSRMSKLFNVTATSNVMMMPFLNRLKAIDNNISVLPPKGASDSWCYEHFKVEFQRLTQQFAKEIEAIHGFNRETAERQKIKDLTKELVCIEKRKPSLKAWQLTMKILEECDPILENYNEAIIRKSIDLNSRILDLSFKALTRIPKRLFNQEELKTYWQNLVELTCETNFMPALPEELGRSCIALQKLDCHGNKLTTLPASLANCLLLRELDIRYNELEIPDTFFSNLQQLQTIKLDQNQLLKLPSSLCEIPNLTNLSCSGNFILTIPVKFIDKFGLAWYTDTIASQFINDGMNEPMRITSSRCASTVFFGSAEYLFNKHIFNHFPHAIKILYALLKLHLAQADKKEHEKKTTRTIACPQASVLKRLRNEKLRLGMVVFSLECC